MGRSIICTHVLIGMALYALMIGLPDKRLMTHFKLSNLLIALIGMMTIWPLAIPMFIRLWREAKRLIR